MTDDKSLDERTLADPPADWPTMTDGVPIVDSSVAVTLENFDIDEWIAGIRPTRRSVKLHPDAHLIARMEEIADRIDLTPDDQDVDALIEEFEQARRQVNDGMWFTLEKRSSEWIKTFRLKMLEQLGAHLDPDLGEKVTREHRLAVTLHQIAAQCVAPAGLTYEQIRRLVEANEGEATKLVLALDNVNTVLAEQAGVMDRDFSERRSNGRRPSSATSGSRSTPSGSRPAGTSGSRGRSGAKPTSG